MCGKHVAQTQHHTSPRTSLSAGLSYTSVCRHVCCHMQCNKRSQSVSTGCLSVCFEQTHGIVSVARQHPTWLGVQGGCSGNRHCPACVSVLLWLRALC